MNSSQPEHHLDSVLSHIINPEAFDEKHILNNAELTDDGFGFNSLKIEDRCVNVEHLVRL